MEINRKLLKPFFEGYKLTLNDSIKVESYPLEFSVMKQREFTSSEYQVMADEIYDNKLKSSDNSLLYYISSEGALISFSRETLKSSVVHERPIDSFSVTECGLVFTLTGKKLKYNDDCSFELDIKGDEFKLLKAKTNCDKTIVLLQSIGKVKDFKKEAGENTAFEFYRIELKGSDLVSCDLLGWSLTRPSVVMIDGERIVLGTSSGIITEGSSDDTTFDTLIDSPREFTNVFNDEEEEDEENDLLNNCRLTEFINSKDAPFPDFTVSGVCVDELQVPIKHLYDVNVYDFRNDPLHVATFPAINFIQTGKIDKKFSVFGRNFALIIETSGNIYCYAKPADDAKVSTQYLIQLEEEIFGFAHEQDAEEKDILYLLTNEKIYKIELQ